MTIEERVRNGFDIDGFKVHYFMDDGNCENFSYTKDCQRDMNLTDDGHGDRCRSDTCFDVTRLGVDTPFLREESAEREDPDETKEFRDVGEERPHRHDRGLKFVDDVVGDIALFDGEMKSRFDLLNSSQKRGGLYT